MIDKVEGNRRIGTDSHYYLIEMFKNLQQGWIPPELVTEELYDAIKNDQTSYEPALVGYVGFSLSFGGKWFGGYRRDVAGTKGCIENMKTQSRRSYNDAVNQSKNITDVIFANADYQQIPIPVNSIIYCDPPYAGTTKYSNDFDHDIFWQWCRNKTIDGHCVYISEYNAPSDFNCVWNKPMNTTLSKQPAKIDVEKLFTYKPVV